MTDNNKKEAILDLCRVFIKNASTIALTQEYGVFVHEDRSWKVVLNENSMKVMCKGVDETIMSAAHSLGLDCVKSPRDVFPRVSGWLTNPTQNFVEETLKELRKKDGWDGAVAKSMYPYGRHIYDVAS